MEGVLSSIVSNNFFHGSIYQIVLINYFFLQCLGSALSSLSWCVVVFLSLVGQSETSHIPNSSRYSKFNWKHFITPSTVYTGTFPDK